jgi:hypothetical protein
VSPLHPNQASKPLYEQLHIFDSAEATTTERLENQFNLVCMTEKMQQLGKMMLQVCPFTEPYKRMQMK